MSEAASQFESFHTRPCPYCGGSGRTGQCSHGKDCEECDGTGSKYHAVWVTEDGATCSMTGSGSLPPDAITRAVLELVARAARGAVRP